MDETIFLYNMDAERNILGAIFIEPELLKECSLTAAYFSPGRNQNIFYTMRDLDNKGIPIDFVSMVERVGNAKLEKLGGLSYLTDLANAIPTTANFKHHCNIVIEYYQKRLAINIANKLKEKSESGNPLDAIKESVNALMEIEDAGTDDDDGEIKDALVDMYDDLESATGELKGIPSGFNDLDRMTGGYTGGQLIIVGARPSVGKTAYAINKGINAAASPKNPDGDVVGIFSLEMGKGELLKRCASVIGNIDGQRMKRAGIAFSSDDWNKLTISMGQLSNMDLRIFDRPGVDINYIWSKTRKLKRQFPNRRIMIIIDYLQLIAGSKKHGGNRTAEIGEISRMLKHMARELDVVVVALSQLSRSVENRQDKRPMLSDLRESGQIEQDADVVQFLYRDDYYDKETEDKNIIEIIVAKQRNGPVGLIQLAFIKEYGKFVNLARA